jgi:RNA polymerase sigma-70 factor, ECF subfamily
MDFKEKNDQEVVRLVIQENQEYYAEIIKRYQVKLTHYLRKFIIDRDELEDILQIVFVKAFRNLNNFNIDKKFSSWIYRIAHNEALNKIKKEKNKISLDEFEIDIAQEKFDIGDRIDHKFLQEQIYFVLNKIKTKYKEPLVLYYFEDMSYEEISDILKIPKSTVGTLIRRGKDQVRKYIGDFKK